jgi:hypothetical protein
MRKIKNILKLAIIALKSLFDKNRYALVLITANNETIFWTGDKLGLFSTLLKPTPNYKESTFHSYFGANIIKGSGYLEKIMGQEGKIQFIEQNTFLEKYSLFDYPIQEFGKHSHTDSSEDHLNICFLINTKILEKLPLDPRFTISNGLLGVSVPLEPGTSFNPAMLSPKFIEDFFYRNANRAIPDLQEPMEEILKSNGGQFSALTMWKNDLFIMACVNAEKLEEVHNKMKGLFKYLEVEHYIKIADINHLPPKV